CMKSLLALEKVEIKLYPHWKIPMSKKFTGTIKLDFRDSKADWTPYEQPKAPAGAPYVLFILYDDTGLASWAPFGGKINMADPSASRRQRPSLCAVAHHGTEGRDSACG